MNETKYLVDNNALIALGVGRVRSSFFRDYCHVTPDVYFEAIEHPEARLLSELSTDFDPNTFEHIRQVMRAVPPGDTRLVDLYKNKGAADPGLIAWVQQMGVADEGSLFPDQWILVTNDVAVSELALGLGQVAIGSVQLAALIDDA